MVLGMDRMEEAKIMGMTPDMATFTGICELLSAVHLAANHTLGILHGNAALGIVHENNDPNHREEQNDEERSKEEILSVLRGSLHRLVPVRIKRIERGGKTGNDARKEQNRDAVSDSPLSLICSPSHIISAVPAVKTRMMMMAVNTCPSRSCTWQSS